MTTAELLPNPDVPAALMALAGGHGRLLWHKSKPWTSATFSGTRDEVALEYLGPEASEAGEQLLIKLDDSELSLRGRIFAGAEVRYHTRLNRPQKRTVAVLELLLVED